MLARMSVRYIDPTTQPAHGSWNRQPESSHYERAKLTRVAEPVAPHRIDREPCARLLRDRLIIVVAPLDGADIHLRGQRAMHRTFIRDLQ